MAQESAQRSLACGTGGHNRNVVIRDCVFGGDVYVGLVGEGASMLVLRNYFRSHTPALAVGSSTGQGDFHTLVIRKNVFDDSCSRAILFGALDGSFNHRI